MIWPLWIAAGVSLVLIGVLVTVSLCKQSGSVLTEGFLGNVVAGFLVSVLTVSLAAILVDRAIDREREAASALARAAAEQKARTVAEREFRILATGLLEVLAGTYLCPAYQGTLKAITTNRAFFGGVVAEDYLLNNSLTELFGAYTSYRTTLPRAVVPSTVVYRVAECAASAWGEYEHMDLRNGIAQLYDACAAWDQSRPTLVSVSLSNGQHGSLPSPLLSLLNGLQSLDLARPDLRTS